MATTATGSYLYAVGGVTSAGTCSEAIYVAEIGAADGLISTWDTARALPAIACAPQVMVWQGYLIVYNGQDGQWYVAPIDDSGALGVFDVFDAATTAAGTASTTFHGYVLQSGGESSEHIDEIAYTAIDDSGEIALGSSTITMLTGRSLHSAVVVDDSYLVVVGGRISASALTDSVESFSLCVW